MFLSIGLRFWPQDAESQTKALVHSCHAVRIVIQRIEAQSACTDAVIVAVLHLAVGERLVGNDDGWRVHVNGLAKLITERSQRGRMELPVSLCNILIL